MICKKCRKRERHQQLLWRAVLLLKEQKKELERELSLMEKENEMLIGEINECNE